MKPLKCLTASFFRRAGICCAALLFLQAVLLSGCSGPSAWADLVPEESGDWQQSRETDAALEEFSGSDGYLRVHFIDVGQGDSILIQAGEHAMLVDAGTNESGGTVTDYLHSLNLTKLDYLIGTHPHEDHIGGLDDVILSFDIGTVIMPDVSHTTRTYEDVLDALLEKNLTVSSPQPGEVFSLGDASFTILSPSAEIAAEAQEAGDLNNLSVGIRLVYGSTAFVLCGDAESVSEEAMVQSGLPLKADVLKAGHHGSSTSTCGSFLDAVDPDYAVISCGKDNSYGHPHQETLDRLHAAGVSVFRTDEQGTVIAVSDGASISWNSAPELSGSSQKAPAVSYVLNRNTMKFHTPDCPSVTQMKEENRIRFEGTRDEAIGMGYSPCGQCNP